MGRTQRSTVSSAPSGGWSSSRLCRYPAAATHNLPSHNPHMAAGCSSTSASSALVHTEMLVLPCPPPTPPALSMALLTPFTVPFQPCLPGLRCLCVPHGRHLGGLQWALRPPGDPPPPVGCLRGQGALPTARRGEQLPGALHPLCSSNCSLGRRGGNPPSSHLPGWAPYGIHPGTAGDQGLAKGWRRCIPNGKAGRDANQLCG